MRVVDVLVVEVQQLEFGFGRVSDFDPCPVLRRTVAFQKAASLQPKSTKSSQLCACIYELALHTSRSKAIASHLAEVIARGLRLSPPRTFISAILEGPMAKRSWKHGRTPKPPKPHASGPCV